jgi:esterase
MDLHYKSFGQGYPLIILHGLFGMSDNWKSIGLRLSDKYTIFLVDQRNHGRSFHHPEMNYDLMAQDIKNFMDHHWVFETFLLGHSMGGKVAMQLALNYPDLVKKLIVIDIAPKAYRGNHEDLFNIMLKLEPGQHSNRKDLLTELETRIGDNRLFRFLSKNIKRDRNGSYGWKMNFPSIYKNYQNLLEAPEATNIFENPSLFVRGSDSDYIMPRDEDLIKSKFPNVTYKNIEGAGHWVHIDAPEKLVRIIETFLNTD